MKLPEDTLSDIKPAGYTVAMWVNIGEATAEHSALFEADANNQYPLTRIGANLIARINANAYSDVQGALLTTNGERGVWQHVAYTVDPQGIRVYLRTAELIGEETKDLTDCFRKTRPAFLGRKMSWSAAARSGMTRREDARFDNVNVYFGGADGGGDSGAVRKG
ncbi:MAG: LamG-like jellyroll fold domain-containing protein [Lachnospiraceae bacterium]